MIVEILGTSFKGHGAELMMHGIIDHIRGNDSDTQFAVAPIGTYHERAEYGFLTKPPPKGFRRSALATYFMSPLFRQTYGIVKDREVDVVLDASGFAYSDQWGPGDSESLLAQTRKWKAERPDKRIILLPQAFGPFQEPAGRRTFERALQFVDLAFARDADSFTHLEAISVGRTEIAQAPDFTCTVPGKVPESFPQDRTFACVAPNIRMLDKTSKAEKEAYVRFLVDCVRELARREIEPIFLTHSRSDDDSVVKMVNESVGSEYEHVHHRESLKAKGLISQATVLIGSRFHMLVSALAQGVPAIGTGWSHKYRHLFDDYECPDFLTSPLDSPERISGLIEQAVEQPSRDSLVARLRSAARRQCEATERMWENVDRVLADLSRSS